MRKRWVALFLGMLVASAVTAAAFISSSYDEARLSADKSVKTSQFGAAHDSVE